MMKGYHLESDESLSHDFPPQSLDFFGGVGDRAPSYERVEEKSFDRNNQSNHLACVLCFIRKLPLIESEHTW